MTIEEKAKAFADNISMKSKSPESVEKMRDIIQEVYTQSHRAALTSLLEELPEVEPLNGTLYRFGRTEAISEIKSLIQTKLK